MLNQPLLLSHFLCAVCRLGCDNLKLNIKRLCVAIVAFSFFGFTLVACGFKAEEESIGEKEQLVFFSGGTLDDQVASVLLFTMEDVEILGTIVANTDCVGSFATQAQWKIQSLISKSAFPIALSEAKGWNPFPYAYRADSISVYQMEIMQAHPENSDWPPFPSGNALLEELLTQAVKDKKPITLLITEPFTPLSDVLKANPELEKGILRAIWMGGAIDVPGNLDPATIPSAMANGKAEWNAFWDPYAVDWIFKNTSFPLVVFPLDVTNQAGLSEDFLNKLEQQGSTYGYSKLAYDLYSTVSDEPYFEMWNTLTTVYVSRPDIFAEAVPMKLSIVREGFEQGSMIRDENGRTANVVLDVADKEAFYEYVLAQLRKN